MMNWRGTLTVICVIAHVTVVAGVAAAQVTGTVTFDGEPPEQAELQMTPDCTARHPDPLFDESVVVGETGGLRNVVVSLKQAPAGTQVSAPVEPAVLDQQNCTYTPRVIAVMVGQPITVKNSDPFLHNVHGLPGENPEFNFAQPNVDPGRPLAPLENPETFRVKCDVHPWMTAWVRVLEHPFSAVTDDAGRFSVPLPPGVADGEYTLVLWHEKLGEKELPVTVAGGKGKVDAIFDASTIGAMAPTEGTRTIGLADARAGSCDKCESVASDKQ